MTNFIKFTLHEFKIGGDYPVHLVFRQDVGCREYSSFIENKNACVINPLDLKELKSKELLLVMNPGHDNFFVKEKNSANKSVKKQEVHTIRHRDARIIY